MIDTLSVARQGRAWAVKHNGSVLGLVGSEDEALSIARGLLQWLDSQGRAGELLNEPRSWAGPRPAAQGRSVGAP